VKKIEKLIAARDRANENLRAGVDAECEKIAWHVLQLAEQYRECNRMTLDGIDRAAALRELWTTRKAEWVGLMRTCYDGFLLAQRYSINPPLPDGCIGMMVFDYPDACTRAPWELTDDERRLSDAYLGGHLTPVAFSAALRELGQ
jgi:hypothetical protein